MPIFAPNWIFSRFTTWIFGGVRILLEAVFGSAALGRRPAQRYWITFRLQFRAAQRSFLKNSAAQLCFSINTACTNFRDRGGAIINENILASFLEYPKLLQHVAGPLHNYHPQKPLASYSFIVILLYGVITL